MCKNTQVCVSSTIFAKLSANVERLVGFITNCDGSIKGRCYGNLFVTRAGKIRHIPSSFSSLAFDNGWEDRKTYMNTEILDVPHL